MDDHQVERSRSGHGKLDDEKIHLLVESYVAGAPMSELAPRFGISRQTMSTILDRRGVQKRRRTLTATQVDHLVHLYQAGWSMARIGERMNVDPTTVLNRLRERRIPTRDPQGRPKP